MITTAEEFYMTLERDFEIRFYNLKGQEIKVSECQIEGVIEFRVDGVYDCSHDDADEAYKYYTEIFDQKNYYLNEV